MHDGFYKAMCLFAKIANNVAVPDVVRADVTVSVNNFYPTMIVAFNARHGSRSGANLVQLHSLAEPHTSSD